jgi:hypothetical protein
MWNCYLDLVSIPAVICVVAIAFIRIHYAASSRSSY